MLLPHARTGQPTIKDQTEQNLNRHPIRPPAALVYVSAAALQLLLRRRPLLRARRGPQLGLDSNDLFAQLGAPSPEAQTLPVVWSKAAKPGGLVLESDD